MENKINIAKLLKDCPKGMELDCTMYDDLVFVEVDLEAKDYPITTRLKNGTQRWFTSDGRYELTNDAKCVIFPKGKTTWEGFVPPCQFKDGDVIFTHTNALKCNLDNNWVSIFKEYRNNRCACHVCLCLSDLELYHDKWEDELLCELCEIEESRLATEEEKQRLFDAIKANGYKWNEDTKTLEKVIEPKFHEEDWVVDSQLLIHQIERVVENVTTHTFGYDIVGGGYFNDNNEDIHLWTIEDAKDGDILCTYECDEPKIVFILKGMPKKHYALRYHCYYNVMYPYFAPDTEKGCLAPNDEDVKPATKEQRNLLFQKMKEAGYKWNPDNKTLEKLQKFKVGDRVRHKTYTGERNIVTEIKDTHYILDDELALLFISQDDYELVPNKFDITTLKPFDKVLVRHNKDNKWCCSFFSHIDKDLHSHCYKFVTTSGKSYPYCIPYEDNQELRGTADDCADYFKTWEE